MNGKLSKLLAALLCCALLVCGLALAEPVEEPVEVIEEIEAADDAEPEAAEAVPEEEVAPEEEAVPEEAVEAEEEALEAQGEAVPDESAEAEEVSLAAALEDAPEVELETAPEVELEEAPEVAQASSGLPIDWRVFPDSSFCYYIQNEIDDGDGILSDEEIANTTSIEVTAESLEGIELFTNLEKLNCEYGSLTSLDLSKNTALRELNVGYNDLTSLNISNNDALESLICYNNKLSTLDVSYHPNLTNLDVYGNPLTTLDIRGCWELISQIDPDNLELNYSYASFGNLRFDLGMRVKTGVETVIANFMDTENPIKVMPDDVLYLTPESGDSFIASTTDTSVIRLDTDYDWDCFVVTALASGSAKVRVKTEYDDELIQELIVGNLTPTGVKLNKTKATMYLGHKATLKATLVPDGAKSGLTWKSSNTKVATVSSKGVVTPKKVGTATITVTTKKGNKKATCKVTVKDPKVPSKMAITGASAQLIVNKTMKLKAKPTFPSSKYAPTKYTVTWKSSNTSVATVNKSGVVTGKRAGTAKITATVKGKSATVKITVVKPSPVKASKELKGYLGKSTSSVASALKLSRGTGAQKYTWFSSNKAIDIIDVTHGGKVEAVELEPQKDKSHTLMDISYSTNGLSKAKSLRDAGWESADLGESELESSFGYTWLKNSSGQVLYFQWENNKVQVVSLFKNETIAERVVKDF